MLLKIGLFQKVFRDNLTVSFLSGLRLGPTLVLFWSYLKQCQTEDYIEEHLLLIVVERKRKDIKIVTILIELYCRLDDQQVSFWHDERLHNNDWRTGICETFSEFGIFFDKSIFFDNFFIDVIPNVQSLTSMFRDLACI